MNAAPSAIVIRLPGRFPVFARYVAGSAAAHAAAVLLLLAVPGGGGSRIPPDALTVNLVAAAPRSSARPAAAPPASASRVAARGARLETSSVERVKKKRPKPAPPKKKKPLPAAPNETPAPASDVGSGKPSSGAQGSGPAEPGTARATVGGGAGSITFLQGDPEMAWYSATVIGTLRSEWTRPILQGLRQTLSVRVAFEISRDGTARNVRIEESSGVPSLDRSALRAVADASPFPPLPPGWREPSLPAAIEFRLNPELP